MKDVYLLSGFLGSGKTSLLTDLLRQLKAQGLKPAVIMNEFGKLPFDSQAVDEDIPLKEMLEGCICCSGAEKTEAQIQGLLHGPEFDVLVIETTGAAHPVEALDAVYSPIFADQLNIKGIITVADSKRFLERETLPVQMRSLFLEQIRHAHLLLANKIDLLTDSEAAKVVQEIQQVNPHAFIVQTTHAKVPLNVVERLSATTSQFPVEKAPITSLQLSTRLVTFTTPVERGVFEQWLRALPDTIYRMKGYVWVKGITNPMLFQYAYGMVQWLPEYVKMSPQLVIIGENVNELKVPSI